MDKRGKVLRVGILGGMGPAATIRLYQEITDRTPVTREQDHLPLLIDSNPATPARTQALLAGGNDPLPELLGSAARLTAAGAQLLAIACNTAHVWYDQIAASAAVPVLHLIRTTAQAARERLGSAGKVGILATEGTLATGLYQTALAEAALEPVLGADQDRSNVMVAIEMVKLGGTDNLRAATEKALAAASGLIDAGAACIILGCTDLSVILRDGDLPLPVVDSTVALAERIIAVATGKIPLHA